MQNTKTICRTLLNLLVAIPLSVVFLSGFSSCAKVKTSRSTPQPDIFVVVEQMPVFPGGDSALMNFITTNIKYPAEAKSKGVQGRVIMRFSVNKDGSIGNITVLKGVNPLLDAESQRVIGLLPKWQPGKQGGKPVNVWYAIPVTFALK